jgi:hypothetical protein
LHKKKINNKQEKYIAMTFNYKKWNNIIGWLVFAIATLVFVLTLEPTTSWWDAGEYIATAYKLEVGSPTGSTIFSSLWVDFSAFLLSAILLMWPI